MGASNFLRNASIALIVLGVALVISTELSKKPVNHIDTNQTLKSQKKLQIGKNTKRVETDKQDTIVQRDVSNDLKSFEENKTLDVKYKSVAEQIKAFIQKQRATKPKESKEEKQKTKESLSIETNTTIKREQNQTRTEHIKKDAKRAIEKKNSKKQHKSDKKVSKKRSSHLPKLVIIMDDVGFYDDIEKIKGIPLAITPSIFPPNEHYPRTAQIAKKFKHYMVHLPMEAYNYKNMAEEAINVSDKIEIIEKKIQTMHKNFPRAKAINNHTGSKYTCNFDAMEEFFTVLKKYRIPFIDSRTASGSQCIEAGKLLHNRVLERDVFLDNKADANYIRGQLKKAVKIAKKRGKAIAICHPKDVTIKVLKNCKDILKGVRVVYIDELL